MSENKTLGREMKILHLHTQKKILMEKARRNDENGNPAFTYDGYLFPEVRKYFEGQEYEVRSYDYPEMLIKNGGLPKHLFFPKDNIILTGEEMKESEEEEGNLSF